MRIAAREHGAEQVAGFFLAPGRRQRVDVPEGADQEGILRYPEIVLFAVAEYEIALLQFLLYQRHGCAETWIVGRQEMQLGEQEQARVQAFAAERRADNAELRVPRPFKDLLAHAIGVRAPVADAVRQP